MADTDTHKEAEHGHHGDEIAHSVPLWQLFAVWGALMVFTVLTVYVAGLGLGSRLSFSLAMIIATIKAGLVMAIFMHLWWDKRLNVLAFLGSFLFVVLFIGMALTDKSEYAPDLQKKAEADAATAAQ
jgi:cytochrome c oxidase subunit IV